MTFLWDYVYIVFTINIIVIFVTSYYLHVVFTIIYLKQTVFNMVPYKIMQLSCGYSSCRMPLLLLSLLFSKSTYSVFLL